MVATGELLKAFTDAEPVSSPTELTHELDRQRQLLELVAGRVAELHRCLEDYETAVPSGDTALDAGSSLAAAAPEAVAEPVAEPAAAPSGMDDWELQKQRLLNQLGDGDDSAASEPPAPAPASAATPPPPEPAFESPTSPSTESPSSEPPSSPPAAPSSAPPDDPDGSIQEPPTPLLVDYDTVTLDQARVALRERDVYILFLAQRLRGAEWRAMRTIHEVAGDNLPQELQEAGARLDELLRVAELELSVERARLARAAAELDAREKRLMPAGGGADGDAGSAPVSKWRQALGLDGQG